MKRLARRRAAEASEAGEAAEEVIAAFGDELAAAGTWAQSLMSDADAQWIEENLLK